MKKERCILLFDDKDQENIITDIKRLANQEFDLDFIFIRTSSADLKKDDSEDLDVDKLKSKIESRIQSKHIDIALTDFDINCANLNGLDIVRMVHECPGKNKTNFFIYSGNWNKVIQNVVEEDYTQASPEQLVDGINKLIHDRIVDCISRVDYKDNLLNYLRHNNIDSIEHRLVTLLRANSDMIFESCFPKFKGKTFAEIADAIDNNSDARSEEWIEAILTQTIAYLSAVNQ